MNPYILFEKATADNFSEEAYLGANPDVILAVRNGGFSSGREHFDLHGKNERRYIRIPCSSIESVKRKKIKRIIPLMLKKIPYKVRDGLMIDAMSDELRAKYNITRTSAFSSNDYGKMIKKLINASEDKLILDCGAGWRLEYYDHVVNFEIADYDTTDVLGVGEELPFKDKSFDAVLSLSVLEHVRDPFRCAEEIARVLKPGGTLICSVPFLQPYHGYPDHYYNMSARGLENLFSSKLEIDKVEVSQSALPIWSLTWILQCWAKGLEGASREGFLEMKVKDLIRSGDQYLNEPFVQELSAEKNRELASANLLIAHKKQ